MMEKQISDPGQPTVDTFEKVIEQLQTTVRRLESGELSMDDSLRSFERGVQLARLGQQMLNEAEQKVELLLQTGSDGSVQTRAFQVPENPGEGAGGPRT